MGGAKRAARPEPNPRLHGGIKRDGLHDTKRCFSARSQGALDPD
jgi:hypothetical protein